MSHDHPPFLLENPAPNREPWIGPALPEPRHFRRELGRRSLDSADIWSLCILAFFVGALFRPIAEGLWRILHP